jgi:hypothetical protein
MATIPGATSINYTMTSADVGQNITCTVIGTNSAGSANGTSNSLGPVTASGNAPVNTVIPAISGAALVGTTLTATSGTWTGTPTPTYAYQWQRGVPDVAPVNTVVPAITGSLPVGSTLTLADGTWTGTAPITYTRQWKRDGVNISGATASTYVLVSGDLGTMISATVTATNVVTSITANATAVGPVTPATATLDPAFILSSTVSLSAGNLRVTNGPGGNNVARSTAGHNTGKYYWEVTVTSVSNFMNGICSANAVNNTYMSSDGNTAGLYGGSGWLGGGTLSGTTTGPDANLTGHVYAFALDTGNKRVWARDVTAGGLWNANATADPATNVNGCNYSASNNLGSTAVYASVSCNGAGDNVLYNFGGTAYLGTPPAGFGNM